MKLGDELKVNSKPMEVKQKITTTISKYHFGPYKIVSGIDGNMDTTLKFKIDSIEFTSGSGPILSFDFVANNKDTFLVKNVIHIKTAAFMIGQTTFPEAVRGLIDFYNNDRISEIDLSPNNQLLAAISSKGNITETKLIIIPPIKDKDTDNHNAVGILSTQGEQIEIKEIRHWDDGEEASMQNIVGYQFFMDNKPVGAIQASTYSLKRKFVWLHNNLDEQTKNQVAAACASILIYLEVCYGN